jgi:transcriptional regulator with XRE-family HTH domain
MLGTQTLPRSPQPLLRNLLGARLRHERLTQQRTLRDVSAAARVSLGYLSEVERGQKEASSELLASICAALTLPLGDVLRGVGDDLDRALPALSSSVHPSGPNVETLPVRVPEVVDRAA